MDYLPSFTEEDESAFTQSCYGIMEKEGTIIPFYDESLHYAMVLVEIERELKQLSKDVRPDQNKYIFIHSTIKNIPVIKSYFPLSQFSPYVQLYFDEIEKSNSYKDILNSLQIKLNTSNFKREITNRKKRISDNKTSLLKYIKSLFEYRSRLLVIRIDLSYAQDKMEKGLGSKTGFFTLANNEKIDLFDGLKNRSKLLLWADETQKHRKELIKQLNKQYKKDLVGYVWKLEYGADKGFHYHTIFFLDGSIYRQDINIARSIGETWKNLTNNTGIYWNLNAEKDRFEKNQRVATGMIKHNDKTLRENLNRMATYLVKSDYFIKTVLNQKSHTYDRGQIPRKNKVGRPRQS